MLSTCPVTLPFWQATIGCFVAIVIVKQLFGGLGAKFANPQSWQNRSYAVVYFKYDNMALPKYYNSDGTLSVSADYVKIGSSKIVTGATPLVTGDASYKDLFLGNVGGCIGETCALALIIGGVYLIIREIISPVTPVAFIGTVALLDLVAGNDVIYNMLAGGLLLGAFFMATDYVTTRLPARESLFLE